MTNGSDRVLAEVVSVADCAWFHTVSKQYYTMMMRAERAEVARMYENTVPTLSCTPGQSHGYMPSDFPLARCCLLHLAEASAEPAVPTTCDRLSCHDNLFSEPSTLDTAKYDWCDWNVHF